jgi:hypothetical protein
VRDLFERASEKFTQESIDHMHLKTFTARFTEVRPALNLSDPSSTVKIGQEASDFLSQVFHDNPKLTPVVA